MRHRARCGPFLAALVLGLSTGCAHSAQTSAAQIQATIEPSSVDQSIDPSDPAFLPPLIDGDKLDVNLVLLDRTVEIAPGIRYQAWTFNGTVPGPVIHARVGQTIEVTLVNRSSMGHSIDFHSALAPPDTAYQTIAPGQQIKYSWVAQYPGVFLYHCGTPPVLAHISNGMYGAVVVDPQNGWGGTAQNFVLLQSEFYTKPVANEAGVFRGDMAKMKTSMPDVVDFNGRAFRYQATPLNISVGQTVRVFVVNAGPSHFSAFHVVGSIFDRAYVDGNPANLLRGLQTLSVPPGGGAMAEFTVRQPSRYPFVTHSFGDADEGAMGFFSAK